MEVCFEFFVIRSDYFHIRKCVVLNETTERKIRRMEGVLYKK